MYGGDLLVRGGRVVLPNGVFRADVLILDGRVALIGKDLREEGVEVIDAGGKLVFPGIVDEHVHMREPGLEHKDDFTHGTKAAAAGGVTTVLEMPNTLPPVDSRAVFEEKVRRLSSKAYVDFGLYGVIHNTNLDRFGELVNSGAVGFKVFLGPTTGNIPPPDDGSLYEALLKSARLGVALAFHAENWDLVKYFTGKVRSSGRKDPQAHTDSRPSICEVEAIQKLVLLSRETGGYVHIVHMSAKEGVELVRRARAEGINVTGETCPHYLLLSTEDYSRYGNLVKVNPPVRDRANQEELWRAVNDGTITALGSDHAPHSTEEKSGDVWSSAAGFTGVQTFLPLMLDAALRGLMPITKIPELMAENPARLFRIYPRKGTLVVGGDGDLVVVDPGAETVIRREDLYAKHPITPYIGWRLRGKVMFTVVRGMVVAEEGKVVNGPRGVFVRRGADLGQQP